MAKNRAKNANFGKNWQKSREISVFLGLKIKKIGNVPTPVYLALQSSDIRKYDSLNREIRLSKLLGLAL